MTTELTPTIASFLYHMSKGICAADAVELAIIDTKSEKVLEHSYDRVLRSAKRSVYSFLHPEIDERIKSAAYYLQEWYLNFENLKNGELKEIEKYIEDIDNYFKK